MKHPVRYLPLVLAAFALHANAQSFSPAWDEYRKKEAAETPVQSQQSAQPQAPAAPQPRATPPAQPYAAPAASRTAAPPRDQGGFFVGAQGGRGWIYEDIDQRALAVSAGYRWQAGPWTQVGVEVSRGRLDSTTKYDYEIPKATYTAVGANARFNFGDSRWFALVRGGFFSADQDAPDGGDFSTNGGYGGLGVGVDINRHFNVTLAYTAYVYADDYYYEDCDDYGDCEFNRADTVMLGVEARF